MGRSGTLDLQRELIHSDRLPPTLVGRAGITFSGLLGEYRASSLGRSHGRQPPRFSKLLTYGNAAILRDLGPRVDPIGHCDMAQRDLQGILIAMASSSRRALDTSPFEITGSRIAAGVHDLGENMNPVFLVKFGGVAGDLPRGTKTPAQKALERRILEEILEGTFSYLPDRMKQYALDISTHAPSVVGTLSHLVVQCSHEWGEYQTVLTAGTRGLAIVESGDTDSLRFRQLAYVALNCGEGVRSELEQAIPDIPVVEPMLEARESLYTRIQAGLN